jgi:uncharacterized protein (TIGR03086 family)
LPKIDLRPTSDQLSALIEAVPEKALGAPTPCSEYCVGDLLDHISRLTAAFGGAALKNSADAGQMGSAGIASVLDPDWRVSVPQRLAALARAWLDQDAWTGMTQVGGQDIPGEIAGLVLFGELTVHGWDLARAIGGSFEPDLAGVESLFDLWRNTFGPGQDEARGAAFLPAVAVAEDAPTFDQTLGLLGREPHWAPGADRQNEPRLTIGVIALGVTDVQRATEFWCQALGYTVRRDGFGGWSTVLISPDGAGTKIALQRSQTPPEDHPRLHFDLHVPSAAALDVEAGRLISLGAERVDWDSYPDDPDFIVLADPEGNRFCIVDLSHPY